MSKRQATQALRATQDARFGEMRKESRAKKQAAFEAGEIRKGSFIPVEEVRPDDMVLTEEGSYVAAAVRPKWAVESGHVFANRYAQPRNPNLNNEQF